MLVWFLWLLAGKVPVVLNPKPVEPQGQVVGEKAVFMTEHYICEIEPISPGKIKPLLQTLGATPSELKREDVSRILDRSVFFKITLTNRGPTALEFNPDHAILGAGRGPIASLLDMATFWPATVPESHSDREKLASVFARASVSLSPNQTHTQYLAFRPFAGRFRRKIYLELNDLYAGVTPLTIKCSFNIKYRNV